jgi:hypothetical protein
MDQVALVDVSAASNALVIRLDIIGGLLEVVALAITSLALAPARRPANASFNFGYAKLENICGLLIAQGQFSSLLIFLWLALHRAGRPRPGPLVATPSLGKPGALRPRDHAARRSPRLYRDRELLLDPRFITNSAHHVQSRAQGPSLGTGSVVLSAS